MKVNPEDLEYRTAPEPFNLVGSIIAYEGGEASEEDILRLFSNLVETGLAWSLQGSYGRTAAGLIEAGWLTRKGEITDLARAGLAE
jgi:fructose-bisphosphate aldolase class 1